MKYLWLALIASLAVTSPAAAQIAQTTTCDAGGIGSVVLNADVPGVKILDVSRGTTGEGSAAITYCLVKVLVPQAINIWVGLPMDGKWNGRLESEGGGGYSGNLTVPNVGLIRGFAAVSSDTGHPGGDPMFGMLSPGRPNTALQIDFAYRSEHLMAVIGKQLAAAFYGQAPAHTYWNGCSTGGRQGLMMAQRYPEDYDGIVAGAPAIHMDRFQAAQIWPQVAMLRDNDGAISTAKLTLATSAAVAACDAKDGIADSVIDDPRACRFDVRTLVCPPGAAAETCLTETEASAINKIWEGPAPGGTRLWWGLRPGAALNGLAGSAPFRFAVDQPRYWVYDDPTWDWRTLDYRNYAAFFEDTVKKVGPMVATDDPDLSRFRNRGGRLLLWHGWADQLIMPDGTIDYYDAVTKTLGGGYDETRKFARLFMAPGVGHCGGGEGPAPQRLMETLVNWVERGDAPNTIRASRSLPGGATRTRPLCLYPEVAVWTGAGSTDDAANFVCKPAR